MKGRRGVVGLGYAVSGCVRACCVPLAPGYLYTGVEGKWLGVADRLVAARRWPVARWEAWSLLGLFGHLTVRPATPPPCVTTLVVARRSPSHDVLPSLRHSFRWRFCVLHSNDEGEVMI